MKKTLVIYFLIFTVSYLDSVPQAASMLPVFRYALENWRPEPYELVVVHSARLDGEETAVVEWLKKNSVEQLSFSNYRVKILNLLSENVSEIPELEGNLDLEKLPLFVLLTPSGSGIKKIVCQGSLTVETVKTLVDSPIRKEIAKRILTEDSAVWVLIESGDRSRDLAAKKNLESGLAEVNRIYSGKENDISSDMPVSFSPVIISSEYPLEFYTISILLSDASALPDTAYPFVVPVFGRGRALDIFRGDTLKVADIRNVCSYLAGSCEEEIKERNPGYDLLMLTDWDSGIDEKWFVMGNPGELNSDREEITPQKSLIQPFYTRTIAYILIMALILILIANTKSILTSSKKVCINCHSEGLFKQLNKKGLCHACASKIDVKMDAIRKKIENCTALLGDSPNNAESQNICNIIIEKASEAMQYEKMGLPFSGFEPAEFIRKYTSKLDFLKMEPDSEKIKEALGIAHSELEPFIEIACIKDAVRNIVSAEELLKKMGKATKIIAFINQKGGVGKTTSTLNIGAGLTKLNKKVLLIDFDPQANLTDGLGIKEEKLEYSIYDLIIKKTDLHHVIMLKDNLHIIPSHTMLTRIEQDYRDIPERNTVLRDVLKEIKGYDFILIDCPPTLGFMTMNALSAANEIYIPFTPEYFALKGIRRTLELTEYIKKTENENLFMGGLIGTRYEEKVLLHQEVIEKIKQIFGDKLYYIIREDISLSEASSFGKSIFDYEPKSLGAEDYMGFCKKILEKKQIPVLPVSAC